MKNRKTKKCNIRFRQWSNKKYAAFSSLKKVIQICSLSLAYSIVSTPMAAIAQDDTTSYALKEELEEIVVTAENPLSETSNTSNTISVISRQEINSSPAQNLNELLDHALNIDLRRRGIDAVQSDLSLRGGTFDQTTILLNGINISDPQTGHFNLNIPVDISVIERIEIIRPTQAKRYGLPGFTGTINIVTQNSPYNTINLNASAGDWGYNKESVTLNLGNLKNGHIFNVSNSLSDGYTKNTDFKILNAFYQGYNSNNKYKLSWQLGMHKKDFGANSFYTPKFPNQYEENEGLMAAVRLNTGKKIKFSPALYWKSHNDHYVLDRNTPGMYQNYHLTNVAGLNIINTINCKYGEISLASDVRHEDILSNNLGEEISRRIEIAKSDSSYHKYHSRINGNVSADIKHTHGKADISAGLSLHGNSDIEKIKLYPAIELGYNASKKTRIYGSYQHTFRMPTFTDLYYQGRNNIGNPLLKPEEAQIIESGIKYETKYFNATFSAFRRYGKDIIDWMRNSTTEKWRTENISELITDGIESSFLWKPKYKMLPFLKVNYAFLNAQKEASNYFSYYAMDYLQQNFSLNIDEHIYKNIGISSSISWQKRSGTYSKYDAITKTEMESIYPEVLLLDTRLYWKKRNSSIFIEASNLLDKQYIDIGNIIQPGRWFKVGVNVSSSLLKKE